MTKRFTRNKFIHDSWILLIIVVNNITMYSQPANIGPQDVPRTSPSNVPRTSPKDPIWLSQGRLNLTSWGRTKMTSRGHSNVTFKGRTWEVDSGRSQDVLRTSPRGPYEYSNMSQILFKLFFKTNSIDPIYLKAC